jgi:hypothetical protein
LDRVWAHCSRCQCVPYWHTLRYADGSEDPAGSGASVATFWQGHFDRSVLWRNHGAAGNTNAFPLNRLRPSSRRGHNCAGCPGLRLNRGRAARAPPSSKTSNVSCTSRRAVGSSSCQRAGQRGSGTAPVLNEVELLLPPQPQSPGCVSGLARYFPDELSDLVFTAYRCDVSLRDDPRAAPPFVGDQHATNLMLLHR